MYGRGCKERVGSALALRPSTAEEGSQTYLTKPVAGSRLRALGVLYLSVRKTLFTLF